MLNTFHSNRWPCHEAQHDLWTGWVWKSRSFHSSLHFLGFSQTDDGSGGIDIGPSLDSSCFIIRSSVRECRIRAGQRICCWRNDRAELLANIDQVCHTACEVGGLEHYELCCALHIRMCYLTRTLTYCFTVETRWLLRGMLIPGIPENICPSSNWEKDQEVWDRGHNVSVDAAMSVCKCTHAFLGVH